MPLGTEVGFNVCIVVETEPGKVVRWCRDGDFLHPVFSASRMLYMYFRPAF